MADFRHIQQDISAEAARAAQDELEVLSESWAYIVGPRSLRPPKQRR